MAGNTELGAVFYCDGGSRPTSSGYGGYGVHGYTYDMVKEIKGTLEPSKSGKPKPTQYGYVDPKLDFPKDAVLVEPKEYVDELEALGFNVTNNQAELDAAIRAIELGKAKGAKRIQLLSDSQYVVVGATNHLANWRENNWVKSDNKPLMNAERWRKLDSAIRDAKRDAIDISLRYVPGHEGNVGNERADMLATRGTYLSQNQDWAVRTQIRRELPAKGYWSPEPEISPFFTFSRCYFTTNQQQERAKDGRYIYFGGNTDKDNKGRLELGKRISDSAYSVIYLSKPDDAVEIMRTHASRVLEHGTTESVYIAYTDNLHHRQYHRDILEGECDLTMRPTGLGKSVHLPLGGSNTAILMEACNPPNLAWRAIDSLNFLKTLLDEWLDANREATPRLVVTEITDVLFETEKDKKGKTVTKVHSAITQVTKSLKVDVNYRLNPDKQGVTSCTMSLGLDLPQRLNLSYLASPETKAYAVTYRESDVAFRFAVIIESGDDVGIWANIYSNPRYVLE